MTSAPSQLVRASLQGDLPLVRQLLDAGLDVNCADEHGMGPLLTFTPAVTEYLLSRGADPNCQKNESGTPVLTGIAYMLNVECVRLLLKGGADPNLADERTGETALHACLCKPSQDISESERIQVVQLLLNAGGNPNRRTIAGVKTWAFWRDVRTRGETPLHRAAAYASEATIALLLQAGADKTVRDANGDSPQSWASWHWRPKKLIDLSAAT